MDQTSPLKKNVPLPGVMTMRDVVNERTGTHAKGAKGKIIVSLVKGFVIHRSVTGSKCLW